MSLKEMDYEKPVIPWTSRQMKDLKSSGYKCKMYTDCRHTNSLFEDLQDLRRGAVFCDIKLKTDDGVMVCGHKVVLVSANRYFASMFISFEERNKDVLHLKGLDSNILQLLIDYIYTRKILVTEQNAMVLLPAAIFLQLDYVKDVCVDFLKKQLNPSNCLGIKAFADFYNCTELLSSSEEYIKTHFLKVIEAKEFLSLCSEEVINLISRGDINVPFEGKVCIL